MKDTEYSNKLFQNMNHIGDIRKTNLTPYIVDETRRYNYCSGERQNPFQTLSLKDLELHQLRRVLRIRSEFTSSLVTINYCLQPVLIEYLHLPEHLKQNLRDLYDKCPRHWGTYYSKNSDLSNKLEVYIKCGSALEDWIAETNLLPRNQREKYLYKVTLWMALRNQCSRAQIIKLFPLLRSGLGKGRISSENPPPEARGVCWWDTLWTWFYCKWLIPETKDKLPPAEVKSA